MCVCVCVCVGRERPMGSCWLRWSGCEGRRFAEGDGDDVMPEAETAALLWKLGV